jgi:hypothetical protein
MPPSKTSKSTKKAPAKKAPAKKAPAKKASAKKAVASEKNLPEKGVAKSTAETIDEEKSVLCESDALNLQ